MCSDEALLYYTKSFLPNRVRFPDKFLITTSQQKWNLFVQKQPPLPKQRVPNIMQHLVRPLSLNLVLLMMVRLKS